MLLSSVVAARKRQVSFLDVRGIRHGVDVEAESLYEAAVLAVRRLRQDPWIHQIGPATPLDVVVSEPGTHHTITLQQIERWLGGAGSPPEMMRKAKLKELLVTK